MSARKPPSASAIVRNALIGWRRIVLALAVVIASVAPASVSAQELWRGLEAGASPHDVLRAFPQAAPPVAVATLADGETDDLVTHGLFWDDDRLAEVRFFFLEGRLASIQLIPTAIGAERTAANLQMAEATSQSLSQRYGAPYECGDRSYADVSLYECKWVARPVIVRVWYEDVAGQAPTLRVVFREASDVSYDF